MSRMRLYEANGGDLEQYYLEKRREKHKEETIIELDEKVNKIKPSTYNNNLGGIELEIIQRSKGNWLKQWLNVAI